MRICSVAHAFPPHYYPQEELLAALKELWGRKHVNVERLDRLHRNVAVGGRHLALPMEDYRKLSGFRDANCAWIRVAQELGQEAIGLAAHAAGIELSDIDWLLFTSVTGIATPSIDARLVNRMGLRPDVKRIPIFGLGCVGGAAGIARAADFLRGNPEGVAVLLSVELCSLTLQEDDLSIPNLIASGLFGDGAAAVVLAGDSAPGGAGPRIRATRSVFYPDTEDVMGWNVSGSGFRIVLSARVPEMVRQHLRRDVDAFLADNGLARSDIGSWVCHPGGPKVLEAMEESLELSADALALTWSSLREVGNLSSTSVLLVLEDTIAQRRPPAGTLGMLLAMGPGFCSELVLLEW
jgi:alkylresorcinol/alkylpyrone synthase